MEWLVPWYSIADDSDEAAYMDRELCRELVEGHPLYGLAVRTLGRRQDCDDVLFSLEDGTGRIAVVHLSWTRNPPDPLPCPHTRIYRNFETWVIERMRPDHGELHS